MIAALDRPGDTDFPWRHVRPRSWQRRGEVVSLPCDYWYLIKRLEFEWIYHSPWLPLRVRPCDGLPTRLGKFVSCRHKREAALLLLLWDARDPMKRSLPFGAWQTWRGVPLLCRAGWCLSVCQCNNMGCFFSFVRPHIWMDGAALFGLLGKADVSHSHAIAHATSCFRFMSRCQFFWSLETPARYGVTVRIRGILSFCVKRQPTLLAVCSWYEYVDMQSGLARMVYRC